MCNNNHIRLPIHHLSSSLFQWKELNKKIQAFTHLILFYLNRTEIGIHIQCEGIYIFIHKYILQKRNTVAKQSVYYILNAYYNSISSIK